MAGQRCAHGGGISFQTARATRSGALSDTGGHVRIDWHLESGTAGRTFLMTWAERGGPLVRPPKRRGFGSTVISTMARMSLDTNVSVDYAA